MTKARIVSDGTANGTQLFVGENQVDGVKAIRINQIIPDVLVTASVELIDVELDIEADVKQSKLTLTANDDAMFRLRCAIDACNSGDIEVTKMFLDEIKQLIGIEDRKYDDFDYL